MTAEVVRWLDSVTSTQDEAHELAVGGAPHGSAVAARIQTEGRGTRGRRWESGIGGLWLSVVCRPRGDVALAATGLRVGLALAEMIDRLLPPLARISLKWPNDLLLRGSKLGGILMQARWQGETLGWMVAGVGINVRNEIPDAVSHPATRLDDVGAGFSLEELAESVAFAVAEATRDAGPLSAHEIKAFADRDWMLGREISMPVVGVALGITPDGQLRVKCRDGSLMSVTGSVTLAGQEA